MAYDFLQTLLAFILTITIVVFIHELGHYLVAKFNGVKVTDFSIGMGPKLLSWKDKSGTEWKICAIPMGGYVKFLGDSGPTSSSSTTLKESEKKHAFHTKSLFAKSMVVVAGPLANFLLGMFILTYFAFNYGQMISSSEIKDISPNTPASKIGLRAGDKITSVDGQKTSSFQDVAGYITLHPNIEVKITFERDNQVFERKITPDSRSIKDTLGHDTKIGYLGVMFAQPTHKKLSLTESIATGYKETVRITKLTLKAIGQIVTGKRGTKELGGPIKIARYANSSMAQGFAGMLFFISMISINLGLINLLPIPPLDGGHLFLYITEALLGKKISEYIQKYTVKIGFIFILGLMLLAITNDIIYF
jgi:regulator of sigma E protease